MLIMNHICRLNSTIAILCVVALVPGVLGCGDDGGTAAIDGGTAVPAALIYRVTATAAVRNRAVTGTVIADVDGVPAEPVDSFVWDGNNSAVLSAGTATLEVNPIDNTGTINVTWTDEHGDWTLTQTAFAPPGHPTGTRLGPSVTGTQNVSADPITTNVYLHGDTTSGGPVLPTVFNLVTTWGPADVTLNGNPFLNTFDGPAPKWFTHTMTTIGVRGADRTVRTEAGGIYNMGLLDQGAVDLDDLEFHLVFHDAPMPITTNVPPKFSFFYHITFEDVTVEILHPEDLPAPTVGGTGALRYEMIATNASRNRAVTGTVTGGVGGVPAEPVDSFVWDGTGSTPITAMATLNVDPVANTGSIEVTWTDEHGDWTYNQTAFAPPGHPTGTRIPASVADTENLVADPIATNVYLHGDTTAGGPVLPTVLNLLTTWGPATVTLNGTTLDNPFDGPAPLWFGHTMIASGVRGDDHTVRTTDGSIYNMALSDQGAVDQDDLEFHFVWHDAPTPTTANVPPMFSFFYHLTFEDVSIRITHTGDES